MLIDKYLPDYDHIDSNQLIIKAPPAKTYSALWRVDGFNVPWIRALLFIRTAFERLFKRKNGQVQSTSRFGVADIVAEGSGFQILEEIPGKEFVVGSVGKFWKPVIDFYPFKPAEFITLKLDGVGKLAWTAIVEPFKEHESIVTMEVRVALPDSKSKTMFKFYWKVIGPFSHMMRNRMLNMAKRDAESGN